MVRRLPWRFIYRRWTFRCRFTSVPSRIAFSGISVVLNLITIIDANGARKLNGTMRDMLYMPMGENKPIRAGTGCILNGRRSPNVSLISSKISKEVRVWWSDDAFRKHNSCWWKWTRRRIILGVIELLKNKKRLVHLTYKDDSVSDSTVQRMIDDLEARVVMLDLRMEARRKVNVHVFNENDASNRWNERVEM